MRAMALCVIGAAVLAACGEAEEQVDQAIEEIDEVAGVDTLEGPEEAGPEPHRVILQAASYAYQPGEITVPPHGPVRFIVANGSDIAHGFEIEGHGMEEEIAQIPAGSSDSLTVEFHESGEYVIYCPVDDHRQRGMTGTVTVQ